MPPKGPYPLTAKKSNPPMPPPTQASDTTPTIHSPTHGQPCPDPVPQASTTPSNPPTVPSTTPQAMPPGQPCPDPTPQASPPKWWMPEQGPCPAPVPQKAMPQGQQGPCLNTPWFPPTPPKAMPAHSAAASGNFVPAGSNALHEEPDDFQSCVDPSEGGKGGTGRSKAWNPWQDSSWDDDDAGQQWSSGGVDWREHRKWGYNSGGIASRARRGLKRMMLQEMRKLREKLGVPQSDLTVSEEAGLFESPSTMAEVLENLATYRVGLEVAHISGAEASMHMAGVEKALPTNTPPWKPHGPHSPPEISGQDRPRVPTLVPQVFSGPPPKATSSGQPCPAPPPPPPPIPPQPLVPPPLYFSEPKGQQNAKGIGMWAQHYHPQGHGLWGSPSSSSTTPMMKSPPHGAPPPPKAPQ